MCHAPCKSARPRQAAFTLSRFPCCTYESSTLHIWQRQAVPRPAGVAAPHKPVPRRIPAARATHGALARRARALLLIYDESSAALLRGCAARPRGQGRQGRAGGAFSRARQRAERRRAGAPRGGDLSRVGEAREEESCVHGAAHCDWYLFRVTLFVEKTQKSPFLCFSFSYPVAYFGATCKREDVDCVQS